MDDTPGRVSGNDMTGRASEDVSSRSTESVRAYDASGDRQPEAAAEGSDPDTARIRRDIDETREELSETIDAIQEKLKPANIVSSATDTIKQATTERVRHMTQSAGHAASNMLYGSRQRSGGFIDGIRENPFPAALIGIGAAWLLMSNRSGQDGDRWNGRYRYRDEPGERNRGAAGYGYRSYPDDLGNTAEYGADYSRSGYPRSRTSYNMERQERPAGLVDRVTNHPVPAALAGIGLAWLAFADSDDREDDDYSYRSNQWSSGDDDRESAMAQVKDTVSEAASSVSETAEEMTAQARDYARDATMRARRTGRRAQSELQRMTRENPLAVGAGALLLGALVGLAIPETESENEWLGETRDSMVDKAQQMARDATNRAQDAAADLVTDAASRIVGGKSE